ncbi:MAG: cupin domain-containing protein [Candidatus Magnetominusculus sp. LBB02]|nr:cupin domain-containing protein [Candidatus Magnetominusculus sp. LBB02]
MIKTTYKKVRPYTTKDGSEIRELMHPHVHGNRNQSLAEAIVKVNGQTALHKHDQSEEIYYITAGRGLMTLKDEVFELSAGDAVCIEPGTPHKIKNTGTVPLKILCLCSPPYSHEDTEMV